MMEIINCEQCSSEWYQARLGIPTASEFGTVMRAKGRGENGTSAERLNYLHKLAGEIITGEPMESYSNMHMERGQVMEPEARNLYSFMTDAEPHQIGFIRNGSKGASPDSLIGNEGALEIKTQAPHLLIATLRKDDFPPEHKAQCQGVLWVAEREWIDIAIYWPKMPLFVKRMHRDDNYIKYMSDCIEIFNQELAQLVEYVRAYGRDRKAA